MAVSTPLRLFLIASTFFTVLLYVRAEAELDPRGESLDVTVDIAASGGSHGPNHGTCSSSLRNGLAKPNDPWWMETIKHQGTSPQHPTASEYKPFRNVKDFGAVGDGVADDTDAINNAIAAGTRCDLGCQSSTKSPAIVYFPRGTYRVSKPIIALYYTQLIGDAKQPPTILADPTFRGLAVIDADPYIPNGGGQQYYINQKNFFRSIRNLVIDVRQVPHDLADGTGIHWQVAQATSLINIVVHMSEEEGTAHQGIWMENGSGGFMGDLVFNGGKYGIWGGNQQFTVRNITVNRAQTGVLSVWNWGWTWQGVTFRDCQVGLEIWNPGAGGHAIVDAVAINTPTFIQLGVASNNTLTGSLVLNNAKLVNSPVAVKIADGTVLLPGGTKTVASWAQGNTYSGTNPSGQFVQSNVYSPTKPQSLLDSSGRIVSRSHPQYEDYHPSQFINVKDYGAKGDGVTDDTAALRNIFQRFADCKIIFFDAGQYIVTDTVLIPAGTRMVGEAWTVLAGKGHKFNNRNHPKPVFKVGNKGDVGVVEITDIVFMTVGPTAGAIIVEWNIKEAPGKKASAGMWDTHIRTAGAAGSNLEGAQCPKDGSGGIDACSAAFLSLHLTEKSSIYMEGTWVWLADHNLDEDGLSQITVFSGRGILSESKGPVWMIGTASEHHSMYQYRLVNAQNHWMGLIQTESPYYQPTPAAPSPYSVKHEWKDPKAYQDQAPSAWALSVEKSDDIIVFGAGLYSFFRSYTQECISTRNCQAQIVDIDNKSKISIFSLATVASSYQISVGGQPVVDQANNINGPGGFTSMVTLWKSSDGNGHGGPGGPGNGGPGGPGGGHGHYRRSFAKVF